MFGYDGNLKRAKQVIDGVTIYSHYGLDGTLFHRLKLDPSGQDDEETDFIRAGSMAVARVTEVGGVSEQLTYIYADHLGSPYMGANASGGVMWTDVTTPYGEAWLPNAAPSQQADMPGFTGHIEDSTTGLTYMQARYYDPVLARFLSNDPVGFAVSRPAVFGRYTYAANNPINMVDPDGEYAVLVQGCARICPRALSAVVNTVGIAVAWATGRVREDNPHIVYRGLNDRDVATLATGSGIIAADPIGNVSIGAHIEQLDPESSPFISTTKSLEIAQSRFGDLGVVAIDTRKVGQPGRDVSNGNDPELTPHQNGLAKEDQEVIYRGSINSGAIVGYMPPGGNAVKRVGQDGVGKMLNSTATNLGGCFGYRICQ